MAVKIRLKRMGKIRAPYYRVVVMDSRTKRDGRAIEEIGKYHPTEQPSLIEIDIERAHYWLGQGAQPTEAVAALIKIVDGGKLQTKEPKTPKKDLYEAAVAAAGGKNDAGTDGPTPRKKAAKKAEPKADEAKADEPRPTTRPTRPTQGHRGSGRGCCRRHREGRGLSMLEEALEHLVKGIVDHDEDVVVRRKELRRGELLEVRVHPDDLGRVIGRSGRTASALRTVVGALAGNNNVRVDIVDTDRER